MVPRRRWSVKLASGQEDDLRYTSKRRALIIIDESEANIPRFHVQRCADPGSRLAKRLREDHDAPGFSVERHIDHQPPTRRIRRDQPPGRRDIGRLPQVELQNALVEIAL